MENNTIKSSFKFDGYIIKSSSITITNTNIDSNLDISISPFPNLDHENGKFTISLEVEIKDHGNNLSIKIYIDGYFSYISSDINELNKLLAYNASAILFPYIRAYISTITGISGMQSIIIPTLNMKTLGDKILSLINNE